MSAQRIDGKAIAAVQREALRPRISRLIEHGCVPGLTVILVGEDPASQVYVGNKERTAKELGFHGTVHRLSQSTPEAEVLRLIEKLNMDPAVHGILVQLPLPKHIDQAKVLAAIVPEKDVDGFHAINAGRLMADQPSVVPCTPKGIMTLIKSTGVSIKGKHAVVIGRSSIVGKPVSLLLLREHATVTICHSRTADLPAMTRQADILVSAVGKAGLVTGNMIKPGAVVIDVGTNRDENGKLCGDVLFSEAVEVAGFLTPVPGGVGPMTIAMLMENTVEAAERASAMEA